VLLCPPVKCTKHDFKFSTKKGGLKWSKIEGFLICRQNFLYLLLAHSRPGLHAMRHSLFVTTNPRTPAPSAHPVAPSRPSLNPSERKSANADPKKTRGTISVDSGNVPDSSSRRRPSQASTRHAAEKSPPLLRTLENTAGTTPAETAKANFVTTAPTHYIIP
jgi:hypothetical protein